MGEVRAVLIKRLPEGHGLPYPAYMSLGAAGADLCAAVERDVTIAPGARALVPTGFAVAIPQGFEAQIRPRSGLALNHGVTCLNSPGTIDCDYRGPVNVILANLGSEPFVVRRGDRIAQVVLAPVVQALFEAVDELPVSDRAAAGFGSTGTSLT
jgi:dUTP pyrophosphatase